MIETDVGALELHMVETKCRANGPMQETVTKLRCTTIQPSTGEFEGVVSCHSTQGCAHENSRLATSALRCMINIQALCTSADAHQTSLDYLGGRPLGVA